MALKALLLRSKLDSKNKELSELRQREEEFQKRGKELEEAITEMTENTTDEERKVVEEKVEALEKEQEEYKEAVSKLEADISEIETQIQEEESKKPDFESKNEERKEVGEVKMENRAKFFGMSYQERDAFFRDEKVQGFLTNVRSAIGERRGLNNVGLTVPEVMLGLIRENIANYSKLYSRVFVRQLKGTGRMVIMGTVPEAVWTEMCATLNELSLSFNDVEVDGYMVGGYFAVCRATLEDSDVALAQEIITALGQAIGYALDKAIVYGTGTKMPLGVITRLAQATKPANYPATAREWKALNTSNLLKTGKTGIALFQEIIKASGVSKGEYSKGSRLWIMNETTYTKLMAEAMSINAAGAIVSGQNKTMPVDGGDIEILNFIPDNDIVFGYFDLYLLAEREGTRLEQSDHVRFLEDQRVFKGLARYDGKPAIAEAFGAINVNNTAVTTSATFATDTANTEGE